MDATIADVEQAETRSPDNQQPALTAGAPRPAEELAAEAVGRAAARAAAAPVAQSFTVAGPSITVSWHDIPAPTSGDWIGVFRRSAPDWDITTWAYTNGQPTGDSYLTVPAGTVPGPYEVRLFSNDNTIRLAVGDKFVVVDRAWVGASSFGSWTPGANLSAQWAVANPGPSDWIGLAAFGAKNSSYLAWTYTGGAASGSVALQVPPGTPPGEYELRLFSNDGLTRLATSHVHVGKTAKLLHDKPNTDSAELTPGSTMTVTWSGVPSSGSDWYGLFPIGSKDTEYVAYRYIGGASGSHTFTIPGQVGPGRYELRLFADDGFGRLATTPIDVQVRTAARMGNWPGSGFPACPAGEAVCSWQGMSAPSAADWVGLYHRWAPASDYLAWAYTGGGSSGSLHLPLPAGLPHGDYEIRMFRNDGFTVIDFDLLFL